MFESEIRNERGVEEQEAIFTQNLVAHANELLEKATAEGLPEHLSGPSDPPIHP
jgi:hypothetical protein